MFTQLIKTTVRAGSQRTFVTTAPKMAGVAKQVSANMLLIFWNAEQLGMNGQSCLVRQQNHKKLPVHSYLKSINCSPHSLSENSGLVCLVWSQSDYEPVLTSFFFSFCWSIFFKTTFLQFCFCFFPLLLL